MVSWQFKWRYKFISRSDKKIGKNIFEIREKYFRIRKSVDRSTPDSDFLAGGVVKKWGKFCIVVLWWKIIVLKIGPELMAVDWMKCIEANNKRILKQKIENGFWKTDG